MTPGARIAAAIDILETLAAGSRPADDVAAAYFRGHRYIGSKDRAQVARHVYSVLRHRAAVGWWVDRAGKGDVGVAPRTQVMAALLVAEGVFTKYPGLSVVMMESGFSWLPNFMWRSNKTWRAMRAEIPWVDRPPADIIRDHVRFTLQPVDVPAVEDDGPAVIAH